MPDNGQSYEIPFKLLTRSGARVLGELMRNWATGGLPPEANETGQSATMTIDDLKTHLSAQGLSEGTDYSVRTGVNKVELYRRVPDTATFLMPESEAITRFEEPGAHNVDLPSQYLEILLSPKIGGLYQTPYANYPFQIDSDGYEEFLDPFMASYMCMQCA